MSTIEATLKIEPIKSGEYDRKQLEVLADEDMKKFSEFFTTQLGNSPPTDYENYFLKTYLLFKLGTNMTK